MLSSCIVYHPQSTDIPLISKKNDLRVDAGISLIPSAQATISYGLTDKIAVQGFGSIGSEERYYLQAATGLYKNLGNSQVFEVYGGFGHGYGNAYKGANPGHLYGNYQLYFTQFNFGKIATEHSNFEVGVGVKAGYLNSYLTDDNYYSVKPETTPNVEYHDKSLLFEPVGVMRVGGSKLRFSLRLGGALIYKFTNTENNLPYSKVNIGLGLNYRL